MKIFRTKLLPLLFILSFLPAIAQTAEWSHLHRGNVAFRRGYMHLAERHYRAALKANPRSTRAAFDLGDVFLAMKNQKAALRYYEQVGKKEKNKILKAMAHHNMGYIHQVNKDFDKAIECYKEALRNNPLDEDTRYNLVLCQKQKKQNSSRNKPSPKNSKSDQKQSQNQQDHNRQQQEKQQQQAEKNNSGSISKDNVEQLLNLSRQAEQQTRQRVQKAQQPRAKQLEKNW